MAALASVPHGASALPASAVPTVLERFPGFVRCVMDIAPEVVGWVIGRSGAHIKEMKVIFFCRVLRFIRVCVCVCLFFVAG